ncbi:MAG: glycosyltransferase family 2 protein [Bacteroidota bacterium]
MQPLVSVITPSYMQGAYIRHCIESVRTQSYHFVEHLIFDAGSTDETESVVRAYEGRYQLQYQSEPDRGQAHAINKGLDQAKGDIICWLNSDDAFQHPEVLTEVVALFASHPEIDVISGGGIFVSEEGKPLAEIPVETGLSQLRYAKRTCLTLQPSTFWRRNDIRLDEALHYAFDWKYWLDLLRADKQFLAVPNQWSQYRIHQNAKTQQDLAARKKEVLLVNRYANNGPIQLLWNQLVYRLFLLAERRQWPALKRAVNFVNRALYKLSGGMIYST